MQGCRCNKKLLDRYRTVKLADSIIITTKLTQLTLVFSTTCTSVHHTSARLNLKSNTWRKEKKLLSSVPLMYKCPLKHLFDQTTHRQRANLDR